MLLLFILTAFGLVTMKMAETRGRSKGWGFTGGFCFGVFGIFYYLVAGETEDMKVERIASAMKEKAGL